MATARAKFVFQAVDKTRAATISVTRNVSGVQKSFQKLQKASRKMSAEIQKSFRKASAAMSKMGAKARQVGKDLSLRLSAPILALGVGILKVAGGFEAAMNRVQVKTQATGAEFEKLRDQAKNLGSTTQFSARQAAQGQEVLATAGQKTGEIFKSLPAVLNLAAAGQIEMAEAARFVTGTLNGFGAEASKSGEIVDILAKASLLADQNVGDMGAAMAKAATSANAAGHEITETAATLSVLAQKGRRAEEGGTALRNFLLELQDPAAKSRRAVEELGFSITEADGSLKSMTEILATFNAAGFTAANAAEIFKKKTADTFQVLESGQGSLRKWNEELKDAGGTAERVAAANLKGLNGELVKLKSAMEGVAIAIGDSGLLAWVTGMVASVGAFVSRLSETNPRLLAMGTLIAAVAASIGPVIFLLGTLASSFSALLSVPAMLSGIGLGMGALAAPALPVIAAVAGVVAVFVALVDAWRNGAQWLTNVVGLFGTVADDITSTMAPAITALVQIFKQAVLPALKAVGEALITGLAVAFRIVSTVIRVTLGPIIQALAKWVGEMLPKVINVASKAWAGFVKFIRIAVGELLKILGGAMSFLGKLPGAVGEGFRDAGAKLDEFGQAVGDLDVPIAEAVGAVSSFGASVENAGAAASDSSPWDKFLAKLHGITGAAEKAKAATKALGETEPVAPKEDPGAPQVKPVEEAKAALLDLKAVGEEVRYSLESGLTNAILNLRHPIQAAADLFRTVWTNVIREIARQIAILLASKLLGLFAGGPLGFLAGTIATKAAAEEASAGAPTLGKTGAGSGFTPQGGGDVHIYQSILPGGTADRARAGRGVRVVDRTAARFILGKATA